MNIIITALVFIILCALLYFIGIREEVSKANEYYYKVRNLIDPIETPKWKRPEDHKWWQDYRETSRPTHLGTYGSYLLLSFGLSVALQAIIGWIAGSDSSIIDSRISDSLTNLETQTYIAIGVSLFGGADLINRKVKKALNVYKQGYHILSTY